MKAKPKRTLATKAHRTLALPSIPKGSPIAKGTDCSSSPSDPGDPGGTQSTLASLLGRTSDRKRWPVEPPEDRTSSWFLSRCHDIESHSGAKTLRRFIESEYVDLAKRRVEGEQTWLLKAKIVYWLQRCEFEKAGRELSEGFWRNYDAAMEGRIDWFDPVIKDAILLAEDGRRKPTQPTDPENAMATTATTTTGPALPVQKQTKVLPKITKTAKPSAKPTKTAKPSAKKASKEKKLGACAVMRYVAAVGGEIKQIPAVLKALGLTTKEGTMRIQFYSWKARGGKPDLPAEVVAKIKKAM